ncbi:hypothetical protein O181_124952 [Austropuccinia psidii MF-1]|uniref:Integrase zinc-binding domain-containing protein n=1 Tax=Austropuccinia psidii MF-1 TaxID=1389203 RepID=A0A9Q3KQK4_9BASI|nr:hypothetical protein [Austropuccinia psidii MF-1]
MYTTNRQMLRCQKAIQEYRGNMTIIYKEGKSHTNADGLSRWPMDNVKSNPAYDPEVAAKIPIHFMEVDRKKNFRFSEWSPDSGTLDNGNTNSGGTETPILGISSSELHNEFVSAVLKSYAKQKQCSILLQLLQQKYGSPELEAQLEEPWCRAYKENKFILIDGVLYHREKHTGALKVVDRDHISLILQERHDCPYMGHMKEDRTKERVARTAWWPKWELELSEYIYTCERCQKEIGNMGRSMQRWDKTHMEPDFKEADQVLVSTPNFKNLKGPKKMRDSFVGPFTIIKLIGKNAVEVNLAEEISGKNPVFPVSLVKPYFPAEEGKFPFRKKILTPPEIVELEDSPGHVSKIIRARKIRLNGKDQRHYLIRFKNQAADKDKLLAEDAIPDGNLHLRRFRASRRTEQSHK